MKHFALAFSLALTVVMPTVCSAETPLERDMTVLQPHIARAQDANGFRMTNTAIVSSATQGNDTIDVVRLDGADNEGPISVFCFIETDPTTTKLAGCSYTQAVKLSQT